MEKKNLFLIDATAFCYRAFYALKGLSTSFGQPTNAIYGFVNMLNKILKEKKPQFLGVCFDVSRQTFRQEKFSDYKIQRPPMPEGLSTQIPLIKEIIQAYGISIFEKAGYEADDIIATLAKKAKAKDFKIVIVSSDKDILQLVDARTVIFSPYKDQGVIYDEKKVYARFGVSPKYIPDIIALMGDSVDNIPGISGIGEKTATELIKRYGSVEKLLTEIDEIKEEKLKNILKENIEKIKLSKELAILNDNVEIDFDLEKLKIQPPDVKELYRLFNYLEFKTLLKNLPLEEEKYSLKIEKIKDKDLREVLKNNDELFFYIETKEKLVFFTQDNFFHLDSLGINAKEILSNPRIKKISHDLKKIKLFLANENINLEGLYFDTLIAGYLLNPAKPEYTLSSLAFDYLDLVIDEKTLNEAKKLELILKLKPHLEKELIDKSLDKLFFEVEMPLVEVLSQMELWGIALDLKVLENLSLDLEKKLIKIIEEIYALSQCQFNLNSPKQLREILFGKLKLPVIKKTKTGPSTDEEVLKELKDKHPLVSLLLEYRQLTKLKSTYIDPLPNLINPKTNRIHTSFNQTATETGRLSSSNPNLQNLPIKTALGSQIRRAIIASSPKNYLLSFDYSQIELRILAHICGDQNLISAFQKGKDIHKATASLIYGLEESEISDAQREVGKRVNFGIIYGLTAYGLCRELGISQEMAESFIQTYFSRYPKVKEYIEEIIQEAQKNGFVTTLLGRRRYLPEINHKNQTLRQFAQRQAINTPIQGSASDIIKLVMVNIYQYIKKNQLKTKMILQIHDELLFDVPEEEIQQIISLVKDKMENVIKLKVPLKVEIKKGKNWLEMEPI